MFIIPKLAIALFSYLALGCSLPGTSNAIRGHLENRHPSPMLEAKFIGVLGGGVSPLVYGEPYPNLGSALDREWHDARLYLACKALLMILSGGMTQSIGRLPPLKLCYGL